MLIYYEDIRILCFSWSNDPVYVSW